LQCRSTFKKCCGVAEHGDHVETLEKELKFIAEYDDQLEMLKNILQLRTKSANIIRF
jgi:hypothetical protein